MNDPIRPRSILDDRQRGDRHLRHLELWSFAMNFRKGDIVSVRGTVKHDFKPNGEDGDKRVFVDIIGSHDTVWIKPDDLTLVSQVFEIGNSIRWIADPNADDGAFLYGVILAISDGHAWIDYGNGDYCTRMLTSIERVEVDGDIE